MTCCGIRLDSRRTHCAYCRRTMALIRERRCVTCGAPVHDYADHRVEGRCDACLHRLVAMSAPTRRLLRLAAQARYRERAA